MTSGSSVGERTWWGQAWIDAVERSGLPDPGRLHRGRTYAALGHVESIAVEPGSIEAEVRGSGFDPYDVEIEVGVLSDDEWLRVMAAVGGRVEHMAALLDGELPSTLIDDVAAAGLDLVPRSDEITSTCSCPDDADPCKHVAAVANRSADAFDRDPFALLALRGRTRDQIMAAVRRHRASATSDGAGRPGRDTDEGVVAEEAWSRQPSVLPTVPNLRPQPGRPAALAADPPSAAPFTGAGVQALAADAAARAWQVLAADAPLQLDLDVEEDSVRWAAAAADQEHVGAAARRLGTSARSLARRAAAWELGGPAGLAMLKEQKWRADPLVMSKARLLVEEAVRGHVRGEIDGNWLTLGDVQLRLSRTGKWWSFARHESSWEPLAGPAEEADALVDRKPPRRR